MNPKLFLITLALTLGATSFGFGQRPDTLAPTQNELLLRGEGEKTKDPTRAALLSAALPGLGQVYNKKYWKLPIIIGGGYALGYGINWNHENYSEVRTALFAVRTGNIDPTNPLHSISQAVLSREADRFRRDRDFLIIGSILAYFIVIVDAYVDAHLRDFPVNKQAGIEIGPDLSTWQGQVAGGLTLRIKI